MDTHLFQIVLSVIRLTRSVELLENARQFGIVSPVEVQLTEFCHRLEPQTLVFSISKGL